METPVIGKVVPAAGVAPIMTAAPAGAPALAAAPIAIVMPTIVPGESKALQASVGTVALFCIDVRGPVLRPFIITSVDEKTGKARGFLLFDSEADGRAPWVARQALVSPMAAYPAAWALGAHGFGEGEFRLPGEQQPTA